VRNLPSPLLYCRDQDLAQRLVRMTSNVAALRIIEEQAELEQVFDQLGDAVLIADVRAPNCIEVLSEINASHPQSIIIAMGAERSDPILTVEWINPFATIDFNPDRQALQSLLKHACECLDLRKKTRVLENELAQLNAQRDPEPTSRPLLTEPLQNFSKVQRNFDNLEALFESVVDGLVATARVSRAGIFIKPNQADEYRFQTGTRCLPVTEKMVLPQSHPFVRWLELNTHLVSRKTLVNIPDPEERAMLKQMLDSLGAEITIPLYAAGQIKGWIFVGQRSTGIPFTVLDLEDLTGLAEHISTTLEKAMQYEETALQKALAETLLHSIPFGIIACDENATIRWYNSTARDILKTGDEPVIGERTETLGSSIADLMHRTLEGQHEMESREWTDPRTKSTLSAETRRLVDGTTCIGAMMMLRDVTGAKLLQEKEEQLERSAFWNELAASMSHEIRNPLVAIKTFAQLLPERYEDPDFRADFSQQVSSEVDQLNHIIDKINEFAHPPKPVFQPMDIHRPIENAVTRIQSGFDHQNLKIHLSSDEAVQPINGDAASLEEGIYHLLMNAAENLDNKQGSRINVVVKGRAPQNGPGKVFIVITDNGSGIDEEVRNNLFSPFSTIKARGLGLGLPIAKRAVIDHNGQLDIETSSGGTSITITLPALSGENA
jgi:signal transduction histidine kinase/GAF domain-containing protein